MTIESVDVDLPPFFCPVPAAVHPAAPEIEAVAHDWLDRVGLYRSDRERARLVGTNSAEFCVAWQIGNQAAGRMPTLSEYLTMRIGSAGGPPTIALLEVANGIEVPAREMDSRAVRALTDMTHLIAALDNGPHSYRRELAENHAQTIVSVLCHHDGLGVDAALGAAVSIRDRAMPRFLALRDEVRTTASPELRTYLDGLAHGIRDNIDWAENVPRHWSGARIEITDEPSDTDPTPLPYLESRAGWAGRSGAITEWSPIMGVGMQDESAGCRFAVAFPE